MRTEYEVLRDALIEVLERASNGDTMFSDLGQIDDDDLAEMAIAAVDALRDAFDEALDEATNDIE